MIDAFGTRPRQYPLDGLASALVRRNSQTNQSSGIHNRMLQNPHSILLIGNCHNLGVHLAMQRMDEVDSTMITAAEDERVIRAAAEQVTADDGHIIVLNSMYERILPTLASVSKEKIISLPFIRSSAYQPDCVYLKYDGEYIASPTAKLHSSIIVAGFLAGLSANDIRDYFDPEFFERVGFLDHLEYERAWYAKQEERTGWSLTPLVEKWRQIGCPFFTPTHPKQYVFNDLALEACRMAGIHASLVGKKIPDRGQAYTHWPVYPGISDQFGFRGNFNFVLPRKAGQDRGHSAHTLSLDEMIARSLEGYEKLDRNLIETTVQIDTIQQAMDKPKITKRSPNVSNRNPYSVMPDYQYWRRSISRQEMQDVDPVVRGAFAIKIENKVATAGSCFAQHIARTIKSSGFSYYVAEPPPADTNDPDEIESYELYSARYGNIYTARQLKQLFQRAFGDFSPIEEAWKTSDGYVDPFRPNVETFESLSALRKDRERHLAAVREMVETLDVFVFTLGLTEAWRSKEDGAVFPIVPGASGGEFDPEKHESINFSVNEVVADMTDTLRYLFALNETAKVILTVSPVPLVATFEDRHVLVSTTYSKSVLRVAAEILETRNEAVAYFPSYEIITGNFTDGSYFEDDKRGVKPEGVAHVMRLFSRHYLEGVSSAQREQMAIAQSDAEVICDEENLEAL